MNPGCLLTAGAVPNLPLQHIVLDDGAYASTGGQLSPTHRVDFPTLARSSGYAATHRVATKQALAHRLAESEGSCSGPTLLHCAIEPNSAGPPPRIDVGLVEHAQRFSGFLSRSVRVTADHEEI
jgi:sulfopyruvate decarboxylase subunit beta